MKKGGGRRYYRPEDITLLSGIRALLYDDGLSIKNVQARIKSSGISAISERAPDNTPDNAPDNTSNTEGLSSPSDIKPAAGLVDGDAQSATGELHDSGQSGRETHQRLSDALQTLLNARERLNDTLE